MDEEFTRINVFRDDYWELVQRFGNKESRPAQGVLVNRALRYLDELVEDSDRLKAKIQILECDIDVYRR